MTSFFRGVNIFVMKRDRGGRGGSKNVQICVTSFMNGPLYDMGSCTFTLGIAFPPDHYYARYSDKVNFE